MRVILGLLLFFSLEVFAQKATPASKGQTAEVTVDGAIVYQEANFDAPVIVTLPVGKKIRISTGKKDTFYRILVKPGVTGWISDVDVSVPLSKSVKSKASSKKSKKAKAERPKNTKPYYLRRHLGLQYMIVQYREKTLGRRPIESLGFVGFKMTGTDVLIEGDLPSEINFMFHSGAPDYYRDITGVGMSGFAMLADMMLLSPVAIGDGHTVSIGFGPMMKYSRFTTSIGGKSLNLEDFNLGAAFSLAAGIGVGPVSLRAEYKYFWETQTYSGLGVAAQMEF